MEIVLDVLSVMVCSFLSVNHSNTSISKLSYIYGQKRDNNVKSRCNCIVIIVKALPVLVRPHFLFFSFFLPDFNVKVNDNKIYFLSVPKSNILTENT